MPPITLDSQHDIYEQAPLRRIRRAWIPLGLLVGVVTPLVLPWAVGGLVLAGLMLLILPATRSGRMLLLVTALGSAASGTAAVSWQARQLPPHCERGVVAVTGVVSDFPQQSVVAGEIRQQFQLDIETLIPKTCQGPETVRVTEWNPEVEVSLGDRLAAEITLLPLRSQWNPGSLPDQLLALSAGIDARASTKWLHITGEDPGDGRGLRRRLARGIDQSTGTTRARGLLSALVVGRGGGISRDDWARFQRLGLSHVLVISGLHIGLVFGLMWLLASRLGVLLPTHFSWVGRLARVFPYGAALLAAAGYALLAGFAIPTQRALVMLLCFTFTRALGWRTAPWRVLLLAVCVVLILDPFAVLGRSLWMSAGATAVLIGLAGPIGAVFNSPDNRSWWLRIKGALLLQLLLVAAMAPVTLFWFGQVSIAAVISNLLFVAPLALWVVPLALLGAVWELLIPGLDNHCWWLALRSLELIIPVLDAADQAWLGEGVIAMSVSATAPAVIAAARAVLAMFFPVLAPALIPTLSAPMLFPAAFYSGSSAWWAAQQALVATTASLTVLDVGQGLAAVWQEQNRVLVYDTGAGIPGGFSQASKVLIPYLESRGFDRIDSLIVSHSDTDHSGGFEDLVGAFPTGHRYGTAGTDCRPGTELPWPGQTRLRVLNGPVGARGVYSDNAGSCVLLIDHRGLRFLLTGDIPVMRERAMIRYWREQLKADVLIVGHHGSKTSTAGSFLKWVRPDWAVISAGRANRFGHPDPAVVGRLESAGITVINTARAGATTFTISPRGELAYKTQRSGTFPYWLQLP